MKMETDLSAFNNSWYYPGRNAIIRFLWINVNAVFINSSLPFSGIKKFWLKLFGAKIGKGVVIKPHVNIKYPWNLQIGNHVWIGESVWIDNLAMVIIEDHVCVSQGALLLCGNHNYKKRTFDLMIGTIVLKKGVWIGAKSIVCPGSTVNEHAVLSVASVANGSLESYGIYKGNPATKVSERVIEMITK